MPTPDGFSAWIELAKLVAAVIGGGCVKSLFDYLVGLRKSETENQQTLLGASAEIRNYVQGLLEEDRKLHMEEKKGLLEEIKLLKARLRELEESKLGDETIRRQMAERETQLLREVGELTASKIVNEATIATQNQEISRLKSKVIALEELVGRVS